MESTMRRFYIPNEQLGNGEAIITGPDAHHLRNVLRLQPGEAVVVFNGSGREYRAHVTSVTYREVRVAVEELLTCDTAPALQLTIAQGYLKDKKMDGLVRQLTELGVGSWMPFLSKRTVPAPGPQRLQRRYQRWKKISIESLKQCGRSRAMDIEPVVTLDAAIDQAQDYDLKLIFWESAKSETLSVDQVRKSHPGRVFVIVGPEGGFEADEIALAENLGFHKVGLGPRILKAETAVLAAVVVTQFVLGDMGGCCS